MKIFSLCFCLFLAACQIPLTFWEEEALEVADEALKEEEELESQEHAIAKKRLEHLEKDHEYHHGWK